MYRESRKNFKFSQEQITLLKIVVETIYKIESNNLLEIILYGSYSKGTNKPHSAIDIMVVLKKSDKRIMNRNTEIFKKLHEVSEYILEQIDLVVYTKDEILDLISKRESFMISAMEESVLIFSNLRPKEELIELIMLSEELSDLPRSEFTVGLPHLDCDY